MHGWEDHRVITFGWSFGWVIKVTTLAEMGKSFVNENP